MILKDTLENYFVRTYDALSDFSRIEQSIRDEQNEKEEFWRDDFINSILEKSKQRISIEFEREYKELCSSNLYFYLCPLKIFKETYKKNLEDSSLDEVTFISKKLENLLRNESVGSFLNPFNRSLLEENRSKQIEYLKAILSQKYHLCYAFDRNEFRVVKMDEDQLDAVLEKYPDVFSDLQCYLNFLKLRSDYIDGRILDHSPKSFWSYIKACLLEEGMISHITNRDFVNLLNEHDLLSTDLYEHFLKINFKLHSKEKSYTEPRSRIFETYFT